MPELPEVEIMARNAGRWLAGGRVTAFVVEDPKVITSRAPNVPPLVGQRVMRAYRRAKHLIIALEHAELAVHFRMTGKLLLGPADGRVRWRLMTESREVDFVDARRLGDTRVFPSGGASAWLESLNIGPEPFPAPRPPAWWRARLAGARGAIKPTLMDQGRVAGIGNILASEILWLAGIAPTRRAPTLTETDYAALAANVPGFIQTVLDAEAGDEIAYVGETREAGAVFNVYAREGAPCLRCGGVIERFKQSSRSTFWCGGCQK